MEIQEFPMKLKFFEEPKTQFKTEQEAINVTMVSHPMHDFRELCTRMIRSTWKENPAEKLSQEEIDSTFKLLLEKKTLTNSMESLTFVFLLEGLTHIEISHLLRHRYFFSIHALCSGDRDLRHDDVLIPNSIKSSKFKDEYERVSREAKKLYSDMVDSKDVSVMDARYVLNRNHTYYYYVGMNLKDAINFINQRKCQMVQPYTDNLIAQKIRDCIAEVIPEISQTVSLQCNKGCHFINSPVARNTRLYQPDANHEKLFKFNPHNFLYARKRTEMGIPESVQDKENKK
jgi:thymidylate synthase ThyX